MNPELRPRPIATVAFFAVLAVAVLWVAQDVIIPFALAALIAFVLAPLVARLTPVVRSRVAAATIISTAVAIGLAGGLYWSGSHGKEMIDEVTHPDNKGRIQRKLLIFKSDGDSTLDRVIETVKTGQEVLSQDNPTTAPAEAVVSTVTGTPSTRPAQRSAIARAVVEPPPINVRVVDAGDDAAAGNGLSSLFGILGPLLGPLATGGMVALIAAMMLASAPDLRDRLVRLAGYRQISVTQQALDDAGERVGRYLRAQLLLNSMYAIAVWLGLKFLIGIPHAEVIAIIAGAMRFVPYIGPWVGALLPATLALALFDGWWPLLYVIVFYSLLELTVNMVLEPLLYGHSTGLSAMGVVIAAIFWTWLWGAVGLVLAVPITVCVVAFARHVPSLQGLDVLLGSSPPLEPHAKLYHRLVSEDEDEAEKLLKAALKDGHPEALLDDIALPALYAAEVDYNRGLLAGPRYGEVRQMLVDLVSELVPVEKHIADEDEEVGALLLTLGDEADVAAAELFAHVAESRGLACNIAAAATSTNEIAGRVRDGEARGVVIVAVPPFSDVRLRVTCKVLRQRLGTSVPIAVCLPCNDAAPPGTCENVKTFLKAGEALAWLRTACTPAAALPVMTAPSDGAKRELQPA